MALWNQVGIYSTTRSVASARGLARLRRLTWDTKLGGQCQCPFCVMSAAPLLCGIRSMVPIWSMCLFLVMWARESLQPKECILYFLYSNYLCIFILHEMYLWNIFIHLVTFYYGMCKVPWYSYGMETCTCHKSVRNGICSIEHLLYEAVPYFEKVITMFSEWAPIGWKRTLLTSQAHLRSGNLPFSLVSKDANFSSYPCFNRYFQETGLQYMDFNQLYIYK